MYNGIFWRISADEAIETNVKRKLLLNIFLVFNVSSRISQKKNFNFGMHLDFHNHEKVI
jgi:hypothetical protein